MKKMLEKLSTGGYRITPQRRLILETLKEGKRHQTADDICAALKDKQPNISPGTVYRNLNLLISLNLVAGVDFQDGRIRYEINDSHHHHLVCLGCGDIVEFPECNLKEFLGETVERHCFQVTGHTMEVFGYCRSCHKNNFETADER
ncbi:MAG: transcriptional repressor [Syntrophomonadaceae bacterium]|nr:transcriptional repressor [Syntrophomonadaceae bacterium]